MTTKSISIMVNGVQTTWTSKTITYAQLLTLAGMTGTPVAAYTWTDTGTIPKRSGNVTPKQKLLVAQGMVFKIYHTATSG